jgi:molecular chaperone DnaK
MTRDASTHADEDKKKKEAVEARNRLDNLIYSSEKSLKELGDKVSEPEKKKVEEALSKAKDALSSQDTATIKKAEEELTAASHKIAEEMYKAAAAKGHAGAGAAAGPGAEGKTGAKDEPVDAEYKVEDDK